MLAIARDGRLLHHRAWGHRDPVAGVPMTLDAVFPLASMTKIMVSVAALRLMQEGRLPLTHQPGTAFECGFSTDVLGLVIEQVTGQRLGEHLAQVLWEPLGTVAPGEIRKHYREQLQVLVYGALTR